MSDEPALFASSPIPTRSEWVAVNGQGPGVMGAPTLGDPGLGADPIDMADVIDYLAGHIVGLIVSVWVDDPEPFIMQSDVFDEGRYWVEAGVVLSNMLRVTALSQGSYLEPHIVAAETATMWSPHVSVWPEAVATVVAAAQSDDHAWAPGRLLSAKAWGQHTAVALGILSRSWYVVDVWRSVIATIDHMVIVGADLEPLFVGRLVDQTPDE